MNNQETIQRMERQLTKMKRSTDECIAQGEQDYQETQEAWQEAIVQESNAEKQARELEKSLALLQEQQQIDQIHHQLFPCQSEALVAHVGQSSSGDMQMEEPTTQAVGNSSHDMSMEELESNERNGNKHSSDDDDDMEMGQVKSIFSHYLYTSSFILGIAQ